MIRIGQDYPMNILD